MKPTAINGYRAQLVGYINADKTGAEVTIPLTSAHALVRICERLADLESRRPENFPLSAADNSAPHQWGGCGMTTMADMQYLGDGVYVGHDGFQIWLAVGDHRNMVIALEPSVFTELVKYQARIAAATRPPQPVVQQSGYHAEDSGND